MSELRAIVLTPVLGAGGLGRAAADMTYGLGACGVSVLPVTLGGRRTVAQVVSKHRPLRRFSSLARCADRRAMVAHVPTAWDLAYAMPGFMPPPESQRRRILHSATHHPRVVLDSIAAARRRAGGGRGFMTAREAELLLSELRGADVIRTESRAVAAEIEADATLRGSVVLAAPGVDLERFKPAPKRDALTIAFVGSLSLWKGLDILVELAARLQRRAVLATIGGPVCPWSRRLSTGALFEHGRDVPALLASAHAAVVPSATDGFGYVALEAMACGTAPFVTPEVGASELVAELDTRLVQPAERFAEAVTELLDELPLAELGVRARALAARFEQTACSRTAAERVLAALRER